MRLADLLLLLMPESALPLVVMGLGVAVVVGVLPFGRAARLILLIACLPLLGAVIEALLASVPWYVILGVLCLMLLFILRGILELFLGREAAGHVLGAMVIASGSVGLVLVTGVIRVLGRALGWTFGQLTALTLGRTR